MIRTEREKQLTRVAQVLMEQLNAGTMSVDDYEAIMAQLHAPTTNQRRAP